MLVSIQSSFLLARWHFITYHSEHHYLLDLFIKFSLFRHCPKGAIDFMT